MTSPSVNVQITGDASGAIGAAKAAQAAIDSLHGRSVDVDVNFRNGGAAADFGRAAGRAADAAGDAFRGFSDRVNRAAGDMGGFRDGVRDVGRDLDRIGRGQSIFNDRDVSSARSIRGELERLSGTTPMLGRSNEVAGNLRQLEESSGSLRAIESATGGAGREMRALEAGASRAVIEMREVGGVFQAVETRGSAASRVIDAVGRAVSDSSSPIKLLRGGADDLGMSLGELTGIAGTAGRALGMVGIAGLYSAAGSGIAAAAVGGMGFAAAVADIASSAPTLSKAKNLVSDFGQEFRKVAPQTTALAMPHLDDMSAQVKAIGAAGAQMGLAHMPELFRAANTALAQVIPTAKALEPAINPAVGAAEALVQQAPRIAAAATPALIQFSNTVANSAEGLGDLAIVGVKTAGALGSAAVSVASTWGERLNALDQAAPNLIPGAADFAAGLFGGKSNQIDPGSLDTSAWNKTGQVAGGAGLGAFLGGGVGALVGLLGGPVGVAGGIAIGSSLGAGAGLGVSYLDDKLPQQDVAMAAGRKVGATYGPGSSYAGSAAPWYPTMEERQQEQQQDTRQEQQRAQQPSAGRSGLPLQTTHPFGEGTLSGGASQLAQINQEMQRTQNLAPQVGQSMQQSLSQAGSAAQQAAPPFQQGLNAMQQHAQQFPSQVGSTMSMLGPALAQPMQQMAQPLQQAMQQAMPTAPAQHLTQAVQDQVQPASAAGAAVGASTGQGFDSGMTKEETHTITKIRKWIEKIIDVAATGLDSHSPSRVFVGLGQSVGQGMALGVESSSTQAVQATQSMIGQMTGGATSALGDQQRQLQQTQQQIQNQQQQAQQAAQQAAQVYQQPPGFGGSPFTMPSAAMQKVQQQQEEELKRAMQTGDTSRLSPAQQQQFEQAKQAAGLFQYPDGRMFDKNRHDQLAKLYPDSDTPERIQAREKRHDEIAADKKDERRRDHVDALMRGGTETSVRRKLEHEFNQHGRAVSNGTADGLRATSGAAKNGVADMVNGMIDESKKRLGIASPSKVFAGIGGDTGAGLASGLSGAIAVASTAAMGVASDRGLQVGYRYAESMVTGMQNVIKTADYQASAVPQIGNDQAKSVLGALGYLGYAGSGAMISKINGVSFPAGGATSPTVLQPSFTVHVQVGDQPVQVVAARVVAQHLEGLDSALSAQVG